MLDVPGRGSVSTDHNCRPRHVQEDSGDNSTVSSAGPEPDSSGPAPKKRATKSTGGASKKKAKAGAGTEVKSNSSAALAMLASAAAVNNPAQPQQAQQPFVAPNFMELWGVGVQPPAESGPLADDINIEGMSDRDVKRLRRKQSNRESARRSRLRKQAECETLQRQNADLASQIQQLREEQVQFMARIEILQGKLAGYESAAGSGGQTEVAVPAVAN
jgi:plant G-box-binding factor